MMWFNITLIVVSVLFIIAVLLQQRGEGLSGTFGGHGEGGAYHTKRGLERMIFIATIILSVLFIGGAFIRLLL